MRLLIFSTMVLPWLFLVFPALAVDDLQDEWTVDFSFHYSRMERTTTGNNINFLSRNGAMFSFETNQNFSLFGRMYFGGDLAYAFFEAPGSNRINPENQVPWQIYFGSGHQIGDSRDFEYFFGLGFSTEFFQQLIAFESYVLDRIYSVRAHAGFSYRFVSMLGTNAKVLFRFSYPLTTVEHIGSDVTFAGVLDATLRLQFSYRAPWSLYGGIRFEDYKYSDKSVTFFNTRVHTGVGIHF